MNIAVYNGHAGHAAVALEDAGGDRNIVEHAVALTAIGKRVMGSTGEVRRTAVVQRRTRGGDCGAHGSARAFDHRRRPGEADAA